MIQDEDKDILENREVLSKLYRAVESQVKTFFLSKQVTYKREFNLEYMVELYSEDPSHESAVRPIGKVHTITITPDYKVWAKVRLIDLYRVYIDEAWSKLLEEIEDIDINKIYVAYNHRYKSYHNWLEESER